LTRNNALTNSFAQWTELALQRIEAQTSLVLSRQIGTPNIAAKGKLEARRVWVPTWLVTGQQHASGKLTGDAQEKKALIEEIEPSGGKGKQKEEGSAPALPKLKGILKKSDSSKSIGDDGITAAPGTPQLSSQVPEMLAWSWKKEDDERLMIIVYVSKEVLSLWFYGPVITSTDILLDTLRCYSKCNTGY
jgi:hypothetical protein